jgi:hypothetical protein
MNTLRVVLTRPPFVVLGIIWTWHGVVIDERFLVGMN